MSADSNTTFLKPNSIQSEDKKMDQDLDERVFVLSNRAQPDVIGAIGVIEEAKTDSLVGVYFPWNYKGNANEFIQEMSNYFGETRFSTLGKCFHPGFICRMKIANPFLREIDDKSKSYSTIRLNLLEIRANRLAPTLILYYDTARMYWTYKAELPLVYKNELVENPSG